jgi:hypothetical protein
MKKTYSLPLIILTVAVLLFGAIGAFAYYTLKTFDVRSVLENSIVQQEIRKRVGEDNAPFVDLLPQLLGLKEPRTYLFLFLNNTEMRPAGGFIGSYAVARITNGNLELLILEGSEQLDRRTPPSFAPVPPLPITEHLGVPQWYFRDANWDPDFRVSAERVLSFYTEEGGVYADEIDLVVAIDTEVLEAVLGILGPVSADGKVFTADNVVELLQYDTSYGFTDRAIPFEDRKQILDTLFIDIKSKLPSSVIASYPAYITAVDRLIREKHIQLYSRNPKEQQIFEQRNIAGRVASVSHDYLLWVDANLAALKTDRVIARDLKYTTRLREDGRTVARAEMTYTHSGTFDWRTSRYRTYARIFVPRGSELITTSGDMRTDRSTDRGRIDSGELYDKSWFGTFISIEPGTKGVLSFTYLIPEDIHPGDSYQLLVQKQAGIPQIGLTLDLEFATNIQGATPAEPSEIWGDRYYQIRLPDMRSDQLFTVQY